MEIVAPNHPLLLEKISRLRDRNTDSEAFARVAGEIVTMLAVWSTQKLELEVNEVVTPVSATTGYRLREPRPVLVPILRAGLGMIESFRLLLPGSEVGFVGAGRDEESLESTLYGVRLPASLQNRAVFVLDPMLATGGTLEKVIETLRERGASDITIVCLIAAPEGIKRVEGLCKDDLTLVVGCIDSHLNENGYIVPGLGDAGDRFFGSFS
jgi:uracil phosphoribosyltransferase